LFRRLAAEAALATEAIIVTGAAGLIGGTVVRRLAADGRAVVAVDVAPPHTPLPCPFVAADLRDPLRHLAVMLDGCAGLIHCGGISGPMLGRDNPAMVAEANIQGTVALLDLVRLLRIPRIVACSSVAAYGEAPSGPVDETAPLRARDVYGASKAAADLMTGAFAAQYGIAAVAMRIGWVYGPGRRTDGLLRPMLRAGLDGGAMTLPFGAGQFVQFIHVDDIAGGLIAALDAPSLPRAAYNLTGPDRLPLPAIADAVRALLPAAAITLGPGRLPDEPEQALFSAEAARTDLGWAPRIGFPEGLRSYAEWLRHHEF
jgi:UDP-glucuronate 4-epimerase